MEFPNLEDTHPRLLVALIFSYKMSTQVKKKRESSTKEKNQKEATRKQDVFDVETLLFIFLS